MKIPNMNSRRIKRIDAGFTVDTMASMSDRSTICDHCATQKCKIRNYVNRTAVTAIMKVATCNTFTPALGFSVLGGLDSQEWNTIRVGGAWAKRLRPGQEVAIIDTKNDKLLSYCEVTETHTGTLEEMVEMHSLYNHAIQAEINSGKVDESGANVRMMRILKNANGTNIAAPERAASVIYLKAKK